jgi:putative ABC transport system ATP-binding protein
VAGIVLEVRGASLVRGGRRVLRGVDLAVPDRGITALVGPSGAGKSSLLRLLNRLEAPDEGAVLFRGRDVAGLDPLWLRRRVGMVFQRPTPFPGTVRDNLLVGAPDAGPGALAAALGRVGLDADLLERPADDLSGGELQRMCLARALAAGPEALLLDEPTSSLDARAREVVEATGTRLAREGVPLVWVTHDVEQAERIADRVAVVADGTVREQGDGRRVRELLGRDGAAVPAEGAGGR